MISAGRHVQLSYNLPRGTYLMFCEVPDEVDEGDATSSWVCGKLSSLR